MITRALEQRIVKEFDLQEVDTLFFYRTVFPSGSLEETGNMKPGKYNAMVRAILPDNRNHHILCVHDDLMLLTEIRAEYATMNCVSYIGKEPDANYARELFAFYIKVNIPRKQEEIEQLVNALQGYLEYGILSQKSPKLVDGKYKWGYALERHMPFVQPTFLVVDGECLYFCFVMNEPIPMFKSNQNKFQIICNDLSKKVNQGLCLPVPEPQSILSERTVVGKSGCRAYRLPGNVVMRVSLEELNSCVAKSKQLHINPQKEWTCKPALFEWFKRQVHANVNNENLKPRVFVTMAAYAVKSGTSMNGLKLALDEIAQALAHRFSPEEIKEQITDAWYFYIHQSYWLRRRTIDYLSSECGFEIKKNPRNRGKKHKNRAENCRKLNNDRKLETQVLNWMVKHPDAKKIDCARALGISPSTVTKWMKKVAEAPPKAKRAQQKKVCPACGSHLTQEQDELKFNKNTGKYRQKVTTLCSNPNCQHYKKAISYRYRTVEGAFCNDSSAGPIFVHVYGEDSCDNCVPAPVQPHQPSYRKDFDLPF